MKNFKIIPTHITDIKIGDTVMHEEILMTVGKNNIKYCSFMGTSLFGDASKKIIKKVIFLKC